MLLCYTKVLNSGSSMKSNSTKGWTRPLGFAYVYGEFNTYLIPYFWSTSNWHVNTRLATDICQGRWHIRSPLEQIGNCFVAFYWTTGPYVISILQEYILLIDLSIFTYTMLYYAENSFDQRRDHLKMNCGFRLCIKWWIIYRKLRIDMFVSRFPVWQWFYITYLD